MPQLVAFNRRWTIGSDDFVYPGIGEIGLRFVWVIAVSVVFHLHKDTFDCENGNVLRAYYIGLLTLLIINIVMTAVVVYVSTRGTITDTQPRRKMARLIYTKFAISFPELVWNIMGTYWAFGMSSGCETHVVWTVKAVVFSGWVIALVVIVGIAIVFDPLGALHKGPSGPADASAKRVWEARCKLLCCCATLDEPGTNAFSGIAEIISNFFQGVDLVPTDIACGLILVHREQQIEKHRLAAVTSEIPHDHQYTERQSLASSSGPEAATPTSRPAISTPQSWMNIDLMCHYMKYAMGSYGWPLYIFTHLVTGTCQLWSQCKCCACLMKQSDIRDDNCCLCNTAAIKKTTGAHPDDIVYASFHNKIYETPFYVILDRHRQSVVVAVRGTLSLKDVITDLTAESDTLEIEGLENCVAHKGILQAAKYVQQVLEQQHILEQAFDRAQGAKLVITGHSLGAGTAALLAILLRPKYPDLICFAFSPPGGLMSKSASQYCADFVCSVVLGKDIIPRLSIHTMEDLKANLLRTINDCDMPKYKLLASGVWQLFCGLQKPSEEDQASTSLKRPILEGRQNSIRYSSSETNIESALHAAERQSEQCRITHDPLFPPGQILQIKEAHKAACCGIPDYTSMWAQPEDYSKVIVSPKMLSDHFPDAVMRALDQLQEKNHRPRYEPTGAAVMTI